MSTPIQLKDAAFYYREQDWQAHAWDWLQGQLHPDLVEEFAWRYRSGPEESPVLEQEMSMSDSGIALVKRFEGLRLDAYPDPGTGGEPITIGIGHTGGVKMGDRITEEQALTYLKSDLGKFEAAITDLITPNLTQGEFDALVSWCFNVGEGAVADSTLRRRLNAGENKKIVLKEELPRWVNGGSGRMLGLVRRRQAEIAHAYA